MIVKIVRSHRNLAASVSYSPLKKKRPGVVPLSKQSIAKKSSFLRAFFFSLGWLCLDLSISYTFFSTLRGRYNPLIPPNTYSPTLHCRRMGLQSMPLDWKWKNSGGDSDAVFSSTIQVWDADMSNEPDLQKRGWQP